MHECYKAQYEGIMTEWRIRNTDTNELATITIPKLTVMGSAWGVPTYVSSFRAADYAAMLPSINYRFSIGYIREYTI